MNIGMMWGIDNPKADVAENFVAAAQYYKNKYGRWPNMCILHVENSPKLEEFGVGLLDGMPTAKVQHNKLILPGCMWVGVEERMAEVRDGQN